jgi:2-oxoglutarate dehydrogenase E1 component
MLRRQMIRPFRRPLIVMTPKSLLRHKLATSDLDDLSGGAFRPVIGESGDTDPASLTRLVMCSGKVYYDLLEKRREAGVDHIGIIRLEQLYPFPWRLLRAELARYPAVREYVWCQEEPKNQGAWYNTRHNLEEVVGEDFRVLYTGRDASPAPAVGYPVLHVRQQQELVEAALGLA